MTCPTWRPSRVTRLRAVRPAPASSETAIRGRLGALAEAAGAGCRAAPPDDPACGADWPQPASATASAIRERGAFISNSLLSTDGDLPDSGVAQGPSAPC